MPFHMDYENDGTPPWPDSKRVVLSDEDLLSFPRTKEFAGRSRYEREINRYHFEMGRVFHHLLRDRKALPGVLTIGNPRVSDRFKRAVEEFEPEGHVFIPLDLRKSDKVTPWPEQYYWWFCERFADTIIPDIRDGDPRRSSYIFWDEGMQCLVNQDGNPFSGHPFSQYMTPC